MTEKSGMEILEELLFKIDILTKKVDVMEQNIKKIANSTKLTELLDKAQENKVAGWTKPVLKTEEPKMRFKFESSDATKMKQNAPLVPKARPAKVAMVKGKMVTLIENQSVPLSDITVKVFDGKDKLVKETKTNRAGQWMAQLAPGKYVAEITGKYKGQELIPQNKVFEVPNGVEEYEVK